MDQRFVHVQNQGLPFGRWQESNPRRGSHLKLQLLEHSTHLTLSFELIGTRLGVNTHPLLLLLEALETVLVGVVGE